MISPPHRSSNRIDNLPSHLGIRNSAGSRFRIRTTVFNTASLTGQIVRFVPKQGIVQSLLYRSMDERAGRDPAPAAQIQANRPVPRALNRLTMDHFRPYFSNPPEALKRF